MNLGGRFTTRSARGIVREACTSRAIFADLWTCASTRRNPFPAIEWPCNGADMSGAVYRGPVC
jgi:hypothetical protein